MEQADIIADIERHYPELTPTGKDIASYLLANLEQLPFETASSIAQATGTSGISVGRLLRTLGYRNLDDFKHALRGKTETRPWMITDRLGAFRAQHDAADRSDHSLTLELEAIRHAHALAQSPVFARVAKRLAHAEAVFILGIQSTRGIANAFFSHLEYLRPRVFYAEGQAGTYVESLNSGFAHPYLVVTDLRAYSSLTRKVCAAAVERGIEVCLVTDCYCTWGRDYPIDLLQVKTDVGQFWDAYSPLLCLFNLLASSVVEQLGPELDTRLAQNRALQNTFGQFEQ
ncbi:MurR/RpiR family transcriptional regulator [Paludibacterium yongneupense]|uniref:MurR/RpiR family transcriptional regulator n=1 Tax=Paludibacterium yongneupense TaxID=400061 RepID=UPI0003FA126B|nr:MurR/RpiR family transcriptional regulator [Paludibacterium yongneupense]